MEGERKEIGLPELKRLAGSIKRPVALFLLDRPLKERETTDYRTLAGAGGKRPSHETVAAIRKARWLQSVAMDMMDEMEMSTRPGIGAGITLDKSPKDVARGEMKRLKVAAPSRPEAATARELYNELRAAVESLNVLVFQAPIDVEQVRGLAFSGVEPNAILVSTKDGFEARRFSLLHEYGHLLLRKGDGMCNPAAGGEVGEKGDEDAERWWGDPAAGVGGGEKSDEGAERWCNHFAAEALMPEGEFREEIRGHEDKGTDPREIIDKLAKRFKTSMRATTIRAINMTGGKRADEYRRLLKEPPSQDVRKVDKIKSGGPNPARLCISRRGNMFVSLVFEANKHEKITTKDVIDYLEVSLDRVDEVREAAGWYG